MNRFLLACLLGICSMAAFGQQAFSTIEERMTGKEFMDSGLDKLTEAELAALNNWLRAHSVATLDAAAQPRQDIRGFENVAIGEMDESTIVSRILGTFEGWDGETVFRLENGMVWVQADDNASFHVADMENPVVTIEKGFFRTWRLSVEGYNSSVRVERIQ
ncbi:MAG: hypothetical protein GTN86_12795 [Xanthomonadales bacterium]|nr:hypothetical protein [Xanthomonadales bacterium]NIN60641.1 hypothetical protein [Xanthomonadales bacterium]NIN75993.1 hypothetical protein [Xanthomonadales bacterium]NIO13046.1 hypothetical protein [Xanthomonadales bacterium]NIP13034.1 hypothetical protein [Xanthomonadales bacterium]